MTETKKKKMGRPPKPASERGKMMKVYFPPDVEAWIRAQPSTLSGTLTDLVRAEMAREK